MLNNILSLVCTYLFVKQGMCYKIIDNSIKEFDFSGLHMRLAIVKDQIVCTIKYVSGYNITYSTRQYNYLGGTVLSNANMIYTDLLKEIKLITRK